MTQLRRARGAVLATLLVPALALSGCGSETKEKPKAAAPSVDLPTGNVKIPAGVTLTKAGSELKFGQHATVAYEPNTKRSSVLSLAVESVQEGKIADFSDYQLDARTRKSRPYYVRVSAKNVGTGDVSRTAVPLLAVDDRNTLIQPSTFNNTFSRCPSQSLPAGFTANKSMKGCLVYLMPDGRHLTAMSFRPLQAFEPIVWKGPITTVKAAKKDTKKSAKKPAKKNSKQKG